LEESKEARKDDEEGEGRGRKGKEGEGRRVGGKEGRREERKEVTRNSTVPPDKRMFAARTDWTSKGELSMARLTSLGRERRGETPTRLGSKRTSPQDFRASMGMCSSRPSGRMWVRGEGSSKGSGWGK
jgi:hypothetical protein